MDIHEANIDHEAATDGDPGFPDPFEVDVPVDEDVKMRVSVLLEFKDSDVLRSDSEVALEINPQFGQERNSKKRGAAFGMAR